jgi:RhtB (resistance to homoserine/threonine) family protein
MENLMIIGTIVGIHFLGLLSPGPDFIMVIKNSMQYSRRVGLWTAVGFGLGTLVHIFYCLLGLAVIISQSILIFNIIKLLGAGYLIYIGVKSIISKSDKIILPTAKNSKDDISKYQAIKIGFLTNILNPKVTLFFLGLFTLVISPDTSQSIILTASFIMIMNTILWFSVVAVFFTQKSVQKIFIKFQSLFNKCFGGILILLGIKVALSQR